jgi:hypothetical protein
MKRQKISNKALIKLIVGYAIFTGIIATILVIGIYHFVLPKEQIQTYTCPKTDYVNCVPPANADKPYCKPDYIKWAEKSCTNFKVAW